MKRDLNPIIEQVRNLLALTKATGFQTNRSIGALLKDLSPDELAQVSAALNLNNQR